MADSDRILKILLQIQADLGGADALKAKLKEVEAQAVSTAESVASANQTSAAAPAATGAKVATDWEAVAAQRAAAMEQLAALDTDATARAQAVVIQQQLINAQMERRVVLETQIAGAEATLAGNTGLAASLEREAEIRSRSLTIQRTLNVSTEEAIVLAEKLVQAEEAQIAPTALAGVNLGKARQEAMVLGREMAAGNVRASTLSSLLGSLGTTFTIAGIGAYELYRLIVGSEEAQLKLNQEVEEFITGIINSTKEWDKMAKSAQSIGDEVKLSDKIGVEIAQLALKLAQFRANDLALWQQWADKIIGFLHKIGSTQFEATGPSHPFQDEADARVAQAQAAYNQSIQAANKELDKAKQSVADWAKAEADLPAGVTLYTQKVSELQAKLDQLDVKRRLNPTDAGTLQAYQETLSQLNDAKDKLNQLGDEQDKLNKKSKQSTEERKEFTAELRQQEEIIQRIRQDQELISANPFLSADQKQSQSLQSMLQEMQQLQTEMTTLQNLKAGPLDPAQLETVNQKLQQTQFQFDLLREKIQALQAPLLATLTQWTNSFGTTMQQVGKTIEGTVNAGFQQLNSLILTGKFNMQQLLQSVIQLGLTLIEQLIEQRAMAAINQLANVQGAASTGPAIAAAMSGAATMVTIATQGGAAIAAPAEVAAAMAAIAGLAGFEEGGPTGAGGGWVHPHEFVFSAPAVRNIGVDNLQAAHQAARSLGNSGVTASSSPAGGRSNPVHIHNYNVNSEQAALRHMKSREGIKLINDVASGRVTRFGS